MFDYCLYVGTDALLQNEFGREMVYICVYFYGYLLVGSIECI